MKGRARVTMRFSGLGFVFALAMAGALAVGCDATRRDWGTCFKEKCRDGFVCTSRHRCEPLLDSGASDTNQADVPQGLDVSPAPGAIDGSSVDLSLSIDAGDDVPVSVASVDSASELDSASEAGQSGPVDAGAVDTETWDLGRKYP